MFKKLFLLTAIITTLSIPCDTYAYSPSKKEIKMMAMPIFGAMVLLEDNSLIINGTSADVGGEEGYIEAKPDTPGGALGCGVVELKGKWIDVGANRFSMYAIKEDGSVWATGLNDAGQLGNGTKINSNKFVKVKSNKKFTSVSGIYGGVIAVANDGTLWGWGLIHNSSIPIKISNSSDWKEVDNELVIKKDGTVWDVLENKQIHDKNYKIIHDGMVLKNDGTLWKIDPQTRALSKFNDEVWIDMSTTGNDGYYGIKADGTLWAWGTNNCCQLAQDISFDKWGVPNLVNHTNKFKKFPRIESVRNSAFMFAEDETGFIYGWGNNGNGTIDPNYNKSISVPTRVSWINNRIKGIMVLCQDLVQIKMSESAC